MRKLKLQMQISVDGYVARPDGGLDWMTWNHDDKLINFINSLTDSSDTILMGRKMTDGFVTYWENVKPDSPEFSFAKKMIDIPKIVFSKTVKSMAGKNVSVENGDLTTVVNNFKKQNGKDLIVYGGANFVSNLIAANLIDEYNLFVNPAAIGEGLRIFSGDKKLSFVSSQPYNCGVVVNTYKSL